MLARRFVMSAIWLMMFRECFRILHLIGLIVKTGRWIKDNLMFEVKI